MSRNKRANDQYSDFMLNPEQIYQNQYFSLLDYLELFDKQKYQHWI